MKLFVFPAFGFVPAARDFTDAITRSSGQHHAAAFPVKLHSAWRKNLQEMHFKPSASCGDNRPLHPINPDGRYRH
ncbi:MAG: hypothetical protein LUD00_12595 [Prevotellaceae bacterium]|nr:hypothetical protein [Prevotellaceae bacterium]